MIPGYFNTTQDQKRQHIWTQSSSPKQSIDCLEGIKSDCIRAETYKDLDDKDSPVGALEEIMKKLKKREKGAVINQRQDKEVSADETVSEDE